MASETETLKSQIAELERANKQLEAVVAIERRRSVDAEEQLRRALAELAKLRPPNP